MHEHDLPYLPVVDSNLRVVGVVRRHSLLTNSSSNCAFLIANPQQLLPLGKVTFEAKTLGNLKRRNYTAFNLLAALSSVLAADR